MHQPRLSQRSRKYRISIHPSPRKCRSPLDRDVQYKLEPNLHREAVSLIRSIHLGTKSATSQVNSGVDGFLRSDSPPLPAIETVEVPIFPRSSWPGFTDGSSTSPIKLPRSMSDLHRLAPLVQIEEEDPSMEHMRMVDGWSKHRTHLLQTKQSYRGVSGLPSHFIAISHSLLRGRRSIESGRRIVPSIPRCGTGGWRAYLGIRFL